MGVRGSLCNKVDSSRNVKRSVIMCLDMPEMFVSCLWKGDFDKLFTVMCGFRRKSVELCTELPTSCAKTVAGRLGGL